MAITVKKAAAGNAPATGMPKQPRARTFTSGPDIVSQERGGKGGPLPGYGMNHYDAASSATMDKIPQSPMAAALKVADDGVLAALVAGGSAKSKVGDLKSSQLRTVDASPFAPTHGASRQQADYSTIGKPALPASLDADESEEPDRQP